MKKLIGNIFFLCVFINTSIAQSNLQANATQSLVIAKISNPDESLYANAPVVFVDPKGTQTKTKTDANGVAKILLPINSKYIIHCGEHINDIAIPTQNKANSTTSCHRYTYRFIDYTFTYTNYDYQAIPNEVITITSSSGKIYTQTTNQKGIAKFYLPLQESYSVSAQQNPDITTISVPDQGQTISKLSYDFQWMGMVAYADFLIEEAAMAEKMRIEDSIRATKPTQVVFFASNADFKRVGDITVYDGNKKGKVIGTISAVWSCRRGPIEEESFEAQISKKKGTYRYYAISTEGVKWEGSYEVLGDGRQNVCLEIK